jgi:RHS repeat-associated protein
MKTKGIKGVLRYIKAVRWSVVVKMPATLQITDIVNGVKHHLFAKVPVPNPFNGKNSALNSTCLSTMLLLLTVAGANAQTCSTCGSLGSGTFASVNTGPNFSISLGNAQYGQSAGDLTFGGTTPDPGLFTPAALQFDAPTRTDVTIITNNSSVILQAQAPQTVADVPSPPTTNGYIINFYYLSNVVGTNLDGTYVFSGAPFVSWLVTNSNPSAYFQLQISEYSNNPSSGLMKQWTYNYSTNTGGWLMQTLGGIQESMVTTNLNASTFQVINTFQNPSGAVVKQVVNTYQTLAWSTYTNVALVTNTVGSGSSAQTTTYTYWDPITFGSTSLNQLINTVTHPDGSWQYYASYDANGNPLIMYSSFQDVSPVNYSNGRESIYTYDPVAAGVSSSGDNGTYNPFTPRKAITYINGAEASCQYAVFPALGVRWDIQCTQPYPNDQWNSTGNLVTTNYFYTSGPNQFSPQSVLRPDGTMTAYNYFTNGVYQTNITVTGQPGPTGTYVVDGVSNVTVLNVSGYLVSAASYDVASGAMLSRDTYGNFDSFNRPQQVTHLDGTTEYAQYACCGLESTVDRDGVETFYLYDTDYRQYGYGKVYSSGSSNIITYQNILDAVGHAMESFRVGSDNSSNILSESAYDLAGELVAQTNALNGLTTYTRGNDPTTGGLTRTTVYPNGGIVTNSYFADGSLKETTGTAAHGVRYQYGTGTDINGNTCTYTEQIKLKGDGTDSSETTTIYSDMAGRTTENLYADGHYSQSFYNSLGQLCKQVDPDGVTTLYSYNAKGEQAFTAIDINQNGSIDSGSSGTDRITQTTNDVTSVGSTTVRRTRNYVWLDGASSGTLISYNEVFADGLQTWQAQYRDTTTPVIMHSQTVPGSSRTVTNMAPDNSYTVSTYSYGRLASTTRYDSGNNQIGGTTYGYDAHGRQYQVTDARNGTTTLVYNNADLVATNTTPNPGGGSPEVTITSYNNTMQATGTTQPDGTTVSSTYLLTGELGMQSGSRTYPVGYSYDYAGRMQTMTNWSGGIGTGARVTTWNYDSQRGWLTSKVFADGHGPSYSYTPAGRLASRVWVRSITTSYAYNTAGSLTNISYSDSTPWVTNNYDRLGRLSSVICNGMTDTLTYNLANELLTESFSGGVLNGLSVTNGYDQYMRRTNLTALASGVLNRTIYGYDNASRLSGVSDGNNNSSAYSYLANSPLVSQITFTNGSALRMTTTKQYDYLNRLTQISSAPSASYVSPLTFNYNYNPANQRTKDTLADGSYWIYGYDSLGQVTNACKYFADGTNVAGQQFKYTFDTIGNRTQTQAGGDATGANLRTASYSVNNLNQITQRDIPAYVDVMGASIFTNAVTVNGTGAYRKEEYFRQQIAANNSSSALWTNIIVAGGLSVTGNVYVAKAPEIFSYDADGNLTNDGRWAYSWDGENRLKVMTVNTNVGPQYQLTFAYDAKGRRIQKMVAANGVALSTNNFLYDGWNLIAETRPDNSLIRSYVWGTDLSGTSQGAGGVGGLLEISYYGSSTTNCFPAYDGNGNIMALVNAADGTVAANYDYAAFGEPIRITGVMARNNPFRFSTKYADDESDLLYYGYRFYKPSTGIWSSRDPLNTLVDFDARVDFLEDSGLGEDKAFSLADQPYVSTDYVFVNNAPVANGDILGLSCLTLSTSGTFTRVGEVGHKWNHTLGNHLTYTACCSCGTPLNLKLTSSVPISSPPAEPFSAWVTYQWGKPQNSGKVGDTCYTYIFQVPWRAVFGLSPYHNSEAVLGNIKLQYDCCSNVSHD